MEWVQLLVSVAIAVVGLYFANSIDRRTKADLKVKVAEKRFEAYGAMWAETIVAAPSRAYTGEGPPMAADRAKLHASLTAWYYAKGNGMLLAEETRNIYLVAKRNLICKVEDLEPSTLARRIRVSQEQDRERGEASTRQLSLLRTSMRGDLDIFTRPYGEDLSSEDREFLVACGVDLDREPWAHSATDQRIPGWRRRAGQGAATVTGVGQKASDA